MSYLALLKNELQQNVPDMEVSKVSEASFDTFDTSSLSISLDIKAVKIGEVRIEKSVIEERSAIREFDGGFSRLESDRLALADLWILSNKPVIIDM